MFYVQIYCQASQNWLETHCPGILVTPRLFCFYLNKSDSIRILSINDLEFNIAG